MALQPERLQYLLRQYLDGNCTREELEELYAAIDETDNEDLAGLLDREFETTPANTNEVDWDHMFNRIVKTGKVKKIGAWKYVAAAILVLMAGAGGMYLQEQKAPVIPQNVVAEDVQPGTNKAVLTLADGSTVALDSAGNRVIRQGHTAIRQQGGQLQYSAGGSAVTSYNTLSTPRGGQFQLTLPDGTKVWLNASSSLKFPVAFNGNKREVTLKGEAYFEVIHDPKMPFTVHVEGMDIADLGTHFNIMAYADENAIKTTLVEGSISVSDGKSNALLKPGQQAVLSKNGNIRVQTADVEEAIAWKNGEFYFNHTSIYEIMRQVSRWYDVDVNYQDSTDAYLSGNIRKNVNVSEVFRMLELAGDVRFRIENKKATVMK